MLRLLILVLACALLCAASEPQYPCTYGDYDLSGMYRDSSQDDYSYKNPTGEDTFYINVCGETNKPCASSYHAGVCQDNGDQPPVWYPCGDASNAVFYDYPTGEEGVQLVYGNGMICNGVARVSTLNIKCDPNAGAGKVSDVDESVSCRYTAAMSSKYACKDAPPPQPTPQPGPPPPSLATFHDNVFVEVDHGKWSGYGEVFYDSTSGGVTKLLVNATDHGEHFGVLSLGKQTQVTKSPSRFSHCYYDVPQPAANNITEQIKGYYGVVEYFYVHYQAGESVKADAWAGLEDATDDDDDDDDDFTLLLLTDVDTGAIVWANGLAFLSGDADDSKGNVFGRHATYEFDPEHYSAKLPSGFVFGLPSHWDC